MMTTLSIFITSLIISVSFLISSSNSLQSSSKCNRTVDVYETITEPKITEENRGKPITCIYTIRIKPERKDWLVFIQFTKFKVGEVNHGRDHCKGGYFQIIDGYKNTSLIRHPNPGYFCGEIDMPKTVISETPYVRIIFHSDAYGEDSYFQFSTEIQKQEEHWTKLGQFHKIRNRRGSLIPDTYCDRVIQDCSPGHCYIHSPGYPEIYPRNLKCRYLVKSPGGLIKLEVVDMDVDGEQCEGLLICFPRPVTRNSNQCSHDYLKVYDGSTSNDPLITTLCGRGRLSSNIIVSRSLMLIEFVSSPAGRLVDTGFQLKIETDIIADQGRSIEVSSDGSCVLQETITDSTDTLIFTNPRSWFPVNTTCSYIFTVPSRSDHISIEFLTFNIERITLCEENIQLFDGLDPDPFRLMNILCDTNKPMGGASEPLYITSGPSLLVQFHSLTGSLDGSSINYRFQVKRLVPEKKVSSEAVSRNCSRSLSAESFVDLSTGAGGSFTINPSDFAFPIDGTIHCNLTFNSFPLVHGRVNLSIISSFNSALTCGKYCDIGILGTNQAKLMVHRALDSSHFLSPLCFCEPSSQEFPFTFQTWTAETDHIKLISNSSLLRVSLALPSDWGRRPDSKPIKINYRFIREKRCGPEETITYPSQLQGSIIFPFPVAQSKITVQSESANPTESRLSNANEPDQWVSSEWPLFCKWRVHVMPEMDLAFNIKNLQLPSDCSNNFLLIKDIPLCGSQPIHSEYTASHASYHHSHHAHHHHHHGHHNQGSPGQPNYHSSTSSGSHHQNNAGQGPINFQRVNQANIIMRREEVPTYINGYPVSSYSLFTDKAIEKIVDIYLSSNYPGSSSFQLYWTQLKLLPETVDSTELLVSLSSECDFFCKSSRSCLRSNLVCNGFPNCPFSYAPDGSTLATEDEAESLCHQPSFLFSLVSNRFVLLGMSLLILIALLLLTILIGRRVMVKFRRKNNSF